MSSDRGPLSISPYITVKGAREAIVFYRTAFGATESFVLVDPTDGRIGHAELDFGGMTLMIADEYPDYGAVGPQALGGSPVKLHIHVEDVDTVFARAIDLGATELRPVRDQFYGDRGGVLVDPFGHTWSVATRKIKVSPQEMQARWDTAMKG